VPVSGDGDFTFTRSSAATRVNADGFIEKERGNLLTESNNFSDSDWSKSTNITLTSGKTGYDGSSDAWEYDLSTSGAFKAISQAISHSGVHTMSVYAKANTITKMSLRSLSGTDAIVIFDLSNGTMVVGANAIEGKMVDVGSGWYRCSMIYNGSSQTTNYIYLNDISTATSGSIYIQDAQLEQGLVARDYIETTTTAVEGGITDNVPRLDYTDSSCPALLLEPQRSNSIPSSEYFGNWNTISNVTLNHNNDNSPEGVQNATQVVPNTSNDNHFLDRSGFNRTNGEYLTTTIYAKANGYDYLYLSQSASRLYGVFDISNGVVMLTNSNTTDFINDSGKIEAVGNGWYRCTLIGQAQNTNATYLRVSCAPTSSNTHTPTYAGDGTSGVLIYGAQVETNSSYATSYIPTYGSSVTRVNDYMNLPATNFYSSTSYTYFLNINLPYDVGTSSTLWKDNDNLSSNGGFQLRKTSPTGSYVGITTHNGTSFTGFFTNVLTGRLKIAIIYNNGEVSVYYNGVQSGSAISVTGWNQSTNHFKFQDGSMGTYETQQFLYIPSALTDQEAIDLTTI
jgi:hypothetical protein